MSYDTLPSPEFKIRYPDTLISKIKMKLFDDAPAPIKGHSIDAGLDLRASKGGIVPAHSFNSFNTGVKISIPKGYVGLLTSKSGLMAKGITSRGTIDPGYEGEIMAILYNSSDTDYKICRGDKITQLLIIPTANPEIILDVVQETDARGANGFGSTGK